MQWPVKVVVGCCERGWGVSNSTDKGSPTEPTVLTRGLRQYQGVIKRGIGGTPHLSLLHDPVFEEFHVNT